MPRYSRKKGGQKTDVAVGTSREITVRAYDRGIHQRVNFISRAITIIARCLDQQVERVAFKVIGECNSAIIRETCDSIERVREKLRETITRYKLMTLMFIVCDDDKVNATQFFAIVAAENIDSEMLDLCAQIDHRVAILFEVMDIIDCVNKHEKYHSAYDDNARNCTYETPAMKRIIARAAKRSRQVAAPSVIEMGAPLRESALWTANVFKELRGALREAQDELARVSQAVSSVSPDTVDILACVCGARMRVMREMYHAVCDKCGRMTDMALSNEEALTPVLEYSRDRRGISNYLRHLKKWLDRLQGIEKFEPSAADIGRLRASIESEFTNPRQICWRNLRYDEVARHLSLCGLSHLSEHIPRVLSELGVASPPILSYDDEQIITRDFMHIMDTYMTIYRDPGNKPYYPFFIVKIIRRRFRGNPEIFRLLHYIPRQGWDTTYKNDRIYENICRSAPLEYDLVYVPETE